MDKIPGPLDIFPVKKLQQDTFNMHTRFNFLELCLYLVVFKCYTFYNLLSVSPSVCWAEAINSDLSSLTNIVRHGIVKMYISQFSCILQSKEYSIELIANLIIMQTHKKVEHLSKSRVFPSLQNCPLDPGTF